MPSPTSRARALRPASAALALLAWTSPALAQEAHPPAPAPRDAAQDPRVGRAIEALNEGDFELARAIVDALFVDARQAEAVEALAQGQPFVAITNLDAALRVERLERKQRGALLFLRGKAVYQGAEDGRPSLYGEAQENFVEASRLGAGVAAAFRASRAARMAGSTAEALDFARSGVKYIDGGRDGDPPRDQGLDLDQHYARTWAEAAFGRFVEVAQGDAPEGEDATALRQSLFEETRSALERVIGDLPTDPWAYQQLANLHQWQQDGEAARRALEAGLAVAPEDQRMHIALARLIGDQAQAAAQAAGASEGEVLQARFEAITARYDVFREAHPENPLGYWFAAYEEFYRGVGQLVARLDARPAFDAAERLFRGCRERSEAYAPSCVDYEILCEVGIGWTMINLGDVDGAIETFLQADALRPAAAANGRVPALEMKLTTTAPDGTVITQIPSALGGIDYLSRQLSADLSDRENLTKVAELAERASALRPEDGNLANNAGFFNRDAAMLWEALAQRRFAQAKDDQDRAAAERARARAQELIEASWTAYVRAAALMPHDVRVVNDTGLIMAYYKRTDPDLAEQYFRRSIVDGEAQLQDASMDAEARATLTEAWGDAHENMGILEWTFRRDPKAAREWFARALEIGPPSRAWIGQQLLPLLDEWADSGTRPEALDALERRRVWTHNP